MKIHLITGRIINVETNAKQWQTFINRLQSSGIRFFILKETGNILPLNSPTISLVEKDIKEEIFPEKSEQPEQPEVQEMQQKEEHKKNIEFEQKKREKDFLERANCKHEQEKKRLFWQETKTGRRYFPVCVFCGHRDRNIGVEKIKDGNAKPWTMDDVLKSKEYIRK